jgi:enoyl-CoA hydratase
MSEELLIDNDNGICTVAINRPVRRNALNRDVLQSISHFFTDTVIKEKIRVVVLRGAGEKSFCSGADLEVLTMPELRQYVQAAVSSIYNCPCPTIALIYGFAVGAGCDIALACDFRVAEETARMGINPVKLGLVYFPDSIKRFIDLIGLANTRKLMLTGRFFLAPEAREMGLLQYMVPTGKAKETAYTLAAELAENAPLAMAGNKLIMNTVLKNRLSSDDTEAIKSATDRASQSRDLAEGVTAFLEKRKPDFHGN